MTLNSTRPKVPYICCITPCESKLSLRFTLQYLVFQIIEVFGFPIGYRGEFQLFEKKKTLKIENSKFQKSPMCLGEERWEENFKKVGKLLPAICRRTGVLETFTPIASNLYEDETK